MKSIKRRSLEYRDRFFIQQINGVQIEQDLGYD